MRIKKFNCNHCGAPKVNTYTSPWIVCDYCFHLVDVDYAASNAAWTADEVKMKEMDEAKEELDRVCSEYREQKNTEAYRKAQYQYHFKFYQAFPTLLTPTISKGPKLNAFIEAIANAETETMYWRQQGVYKPMHEAYAALLYYYKDGNEYIEYDSFMRYFAEVRKIQERIFRVQYDNPAHRIFHEAVPEEFQRKMRISEMAQKYVPVLEQPHADDFLKQCGLLHEFVDLPDPVRENITCGGCKKQILVARGAVRCICEDCRHENILRTSVNCHSCGSEHELKPEWKNIFDCTNCKTEVRVVIPVYEK